LKSEILFYIYFFEKLCPFFTHFWTRLLFIYEIFLRTSDAPSLQVLDCPELNRKARLTAFNGVGIGC